MNVAYNSRKNEELIVIKDKYLFTVIFIVGININTSSNKDKNKYY